MDDDTLLPRLTKYIKASGAISITDYMHLCHSDEEGGYYAANHPIGATGDFITAPEISQMFGEVIAIWCVAQWQTLGKPAPFTIAEFGPGRATLMNDILRSIKNFPDMADAAKIAMVETSPTLIEQQSQVLAESSFQITWIADTAKLENQPTIIIANELFDAIPFRQFVKKEDLWLENAISLDDKERLQFNLSNTQLDPAFLPMHHEDEPQGSVFEHAPARSAIAQQMGEHLKKYGGAGLLIDYGHEKSSFGDTFQAVKNHAVVSPLDYPGQSDLTSHVDFDIIIQTVSATGTQVQPLQNQMDFLLEYGILERAGQLGAGKSAELQVKLTNDIERLIGEDQMGKLFKVLQFSSPVL